MLRHFNDPFTRVRRTTELTEARKALAFIRVIVRGLRCMLLLGWNAEHRNFCYYSL